MDSQFNPASHENNLAGKIVVTLERVSEVFRVLLWKESKKVKLSPIQIQILIFLLFHSSEKSKISYIAHEFNMTKATISDSLKVLIRKKLVEKIDDPRDARSYCVSMTPQGRDIARQVAGFAQVMELALEELPAEQKEAIFNGMFHIIHKFNSLGMLSVQRMCLTCQYYEVLDKKNFCKFLNTFLSNEELRIDCPEYKQ